MKLFVEYYEFLYIVYDSFVGYDIDFFFRILCKLLYHLT